MNIQRKICRLLYLSAFVVLMAACHKSNSPGDRILIESRVGHIDLYGGLVPAFKPHELKAAGVEYGDLLAISIGEGINISMPYVDAFSEVGNMSPCICNYNRRDKELIVSFSNGSFADYIGGKTGDRFIVRMEKKGGYIKEYDLLHCVYSDKREEYSSDEVFANFREITTSGIKPGVLFRSTSPINFKDNKVRYRYASDLCRKHGIMTIVDIADSDEKIRNFLSRQESEGSYMKECLSKGNIIGLGSNSDFIAKPFMNSMATAFREMPSKPAPYLIHCNEGKDRTGFYLIVLEALCGADIDEIKEDFMMTFENLYHQKKGTEQYELTWTKNGFRMAYLIAHPEEWKDVTSIDWSRASLDGADLEEAARKYLLKAGMTDEEINNLVYICKN